MKAYNYDAVIYDDDVYCIDCLPKWVKRNYKENEDVYPIFVSSEVTTYPVCCVCGEKHDYMNLIGKNNE